MFWLEQTLFDLFSRCPFEFEFNGRLECNSLCSTIELGTQQNSQSTTHEQTITKRSFKMTSFQIQVHQSITLKLKQGCPATLMQGLPLGSG